MGRGQGTSPWRKRGGWGLLDLHPFALHRPAASVRHMQRCPFRAFQTRGYSSYSIEMRRGSPFISSRRAERGGCTREFIFTDEQKHSPLKVHHVTINNANSRLLAPIENTKMGTFFLLFLFESSFNLTGDKKSTMSHWTIETYRGEATKCKRYSNGEDNKSYTITAISSLKREINKNLISNYFI